jgi:hypothetical protein
VGGKQVVDSTIRGGGGWMMQSKWGADKTTRGLEMGRWTMRGRVVEVAALQPVGRCNGETTRRCDDAADATGR